MTASLRVIAMCLSRAGHLSLHITELHLTLQLAELLPCHLCIILSRSRDMRSNLSIL